MRTDLYLAMGLQACFFSPEGTFYLGEDRSKKLLSDILSFLNGKSTVMLTTSIHRPDDGFYGSEPTSCIVGSRDVVMMPEVPGRYKLRAVCERPNLLHNQQVKNLLSSIDIATVHIVGAETHSCVLFTAAAMRDANHRVIVHPGLLASRDSYLHDSALTIMSSTLGVEIADE